MSEYTIRRGKTIFHAFAMHHDLIGTDPIEAIKKGSVCWYVHHKGQIVGYCVARELEGFLFLSSAGVLAEARGKGLQKRMIRTRVRYAKSRGIKVIITYTSADNAASINNLIACGFRVYNPTRAYVGPDWVYWRRDL